MIEHQLLMFLILFGAAAIPFAARRIAAPSAALEIIYGILLFHLGWKEIPDWFLLLKEIGLIYLMFIAGMELDLRGLPRGGRLAGYLLIPLLSLTVTPLLFAVAGQPFYLGLAVAMISAGIVVPVLKEAGLIRTPLGRHIIGVALAGELFSILALVLIDTYHKYGVTPWAALEIFKLALLFGLSVLVLKLLYLIAWWNPERIEKVMSSEDPSEEGIRVVITVAFAGGLVAFWAGAEPILGSFLGGVIFSHVFKNRERFEEKINAVGFGFFTPFFFIGVGAAFDPALLLSPSALLTGLALAGMVLVSNLYPLLLAPLLHLRLLEGAGMALILSAPLSLLVVAGELGERMGFLDQRLKGTLVLCALIASILYPSLFRRLAPRLAAGGAGQGKPAAVER